jgi:peptide-methionine (S)-S-oxide reductase
MSETVRRAAFGAGCFWGVQASFDRIKGVVSTQVGYMGGRTESPTYEQVCTNRTGHAETVEVQYDPEQVSYEQLLEAFWNMHDPTTPNRQGPDVGAQYRSVVFYYDEGQRQAAEAMKERLSRSGRFSRPIVTEIVPAETFWRAEEYHQKYHEKHGGACRI